MKCQLIELNMLNNSAGCNEDVENECDKCSWLITEKIMEKKRTAVKRFVPINEKDYKIDDSVAKINHKYREEKRSSIRISKLW